MVLAKFYFIALLVLFLPNYLLQPYVRQHEMLDALFFAIAVIGYVGYILNKNLLHRFFWQAYLVIYVGWNVIYHFFVPASEHTYKLLEQIQMSQNNAGVITIILLLPLLNGLWVYAYERDSTWK